MTEINTRNIALHVVDPDGADMASRVEKLTSAADLVERIRRLAEAPGGDRRTVLLVVPRTGREPLTLVRTIPVEDVAELHKLLDGEL